MLLISTLLGSITENAGMFLITISVIAAFMLIAYFVEKKFKKSCEISKTHYTILVAMLSAIAAVLMFFEFPIPFIAPGFYKVDLSEIPVIIGAFAMGPFAGVVIEFIKILLHLFIKGTSTAFVGEFANFIIGISYILPASTLYLIKKTKKVAVAGLISGTAITTFVGVFMNAFVLLPFYANVCGGMEGIIAAGTAVNSMIDSVLTFCIIAVAPFNLLKFTIVSLTTYLMYHKISPVLKLSHTSQSKTQISNKLSIHR